MKVQYTKVKLTFSQEEMQVLSNALEIARCAAAALYAGNGEYIMGHGMTPEQIKKVAEFIQRWPQV